MIKHAKKNPKVFFSLETSKWYSDKMAQFSSLSKSIVVQRSGFEEPMLSAVWKACY